MSIATLEIPRKCPGKFVSIQFSTCLLSTNSSTKPQATGRRLSPHRQHACLFTTGTMLTEDTLAWSIPKSSPLSCNIIISYNIYIIYDIYLLLFTEVFNSGPHTC
jgi:hypothetical protein